MRIASRALPPILLPFLLACGTAQRETPAEMLERAEIRDGWLGTLLPVAVAGLLLLLLITLQRRRGGTSLDGLFRQRQPAEATRPVRDAIAGYRRRKAEREREDALMIAAAEEARQAHLRAMERDAVNPAAMIMGPNGRSPILTANQHLRVRSGDKAQVTGIVIDITEAGLKLRDGDERAIDIPWGEIRHIARRHGRERRVGIPLALAGVFAVIGGAFGLLVSVTSWDEPSPTYGRRGFFMGAAAGGLLGTLIMFALPGPWWKTIVDVPPDAEPLTLASIPARAMVAPTSSGVAPGDWGPTSPVEVLARLALVALLTMLLWAIRPR